MARSRGVEWEFVQGDFMREPRRQPPGLTRARSRPRRIFCTEIEHREWRVAAAIGNLRQRRIPEAMGRVACGMAMNCSLSPPLPMGPCINPPWVPAALLPGYLTSGNCTSSGNCSWSQTRAALSP